jgi:4-hydroxy-L-threonine phosphate dehydrogenase PdxA
MSAAPKATVALAFGDPAGIGPELVAKLAARGELMQQANAVLVGDRWVWEDGQRVAGGRRCGRSRRSTGHTGANAVTAVLLYDLSEDGQSTVVAACPSSWCSSISAVWLVRRWARERVAAQGRRVRFPLS